jgi:phosphocarrier protein FPr
MVGIVIVSHSRRLAQGVKELAGEMIQGQVPIEIAGGIDDPANPLGTDPMKVLAAIESVHSAGAESVLILMDLGSALMSADAALDFLPEALKERVRLCAAPLVEGAVAAAVQASTEAPLDVVAKEALTALAAKQRHLSENAAVPLSVAGDLPSEEDANDAVETLLVVKNPLGLHARPAAKLLHTAAGFNCQVTVFKGERSANANSINQLATLAVCKGDEIRVQAEGPEAQAAISAIRRLIADNFGEGAEPVPQRQPTAVPIGAVDLSEPIVGIPASEGVAIGPVHLHQPTLPQIDLRPIDDPEAEIRRLADAMSRARSEIKRLVQGAKKTAGDNTPSIFEYHQLVLGDPDLLQRARAAIRRDRVSAGTAWRRVLDATMEAYGSSESVYMQARTADVMDVGNRVFRQLADQPEKPLHLDLPAVIAAHDLLPSEVAQLDPGMTLGIITAMGGRNSHAAILIRSLGIPAVAGAGPAVDAIAPGTEVGLDGNEGRIWLSPDETVRGDLKARRSQWLDQKRRLKEVGHKPAVTTDGAIIYVTANIGLPQEAALALESGAEGVGLFRSEFLFQQKGAPPTETEQYAAYTAAAKGMQNHPVVIRTLDAGGDKPLPFLAAPSEDNPSLGERGLRFCLSHTKLFKCQLRALIRAAQEENIQIMFPMVSELAELLAARTLVQEVRKELALQGVACHKPLDTGVMIEVPASALMAEQLAQAADFFSIGTNDLAQYVMAADRGNAAVSPLCDSFHPAVLKMVQTAVEAGHRAGIPVSMCGEMAGDPEAMPLLIGLGLDQLSMHAHRVPKVKAAIRKLTAAKCRTLTRRALKQADGQSVRKLLQKATNLKI